MGVCSPVLQILTLFQTEKCHFPDPFSDLVFKQKLGTGHYLSPGGVGGFWAKHDEI